MTGMMDETQQRQTAEDLLVVERAIASLQTAFDAITVQIESLLEPRGADAG